MTTARLRSERSKYGFMIDMVKECHHCGATQKIRMIDHE